MLIFLIGHRGCGKTSLLARLARYFPADVFRDLDAEIEKMAGAKIPEIFAREGEAGFRRRENQTLATVLESSRELFSKPSGEGALWVALGAGCSLDFAAPANSRYLWVRRTTDSWGRIFLDRPLLEGGSVPPLQDFLKRFPERELNYSAKADRIYEVPEGLRAVENSEASSTLEKSLLASLRISKADEEREDRVDAGADSPYVTILRDPGKKILWPEGRPRPCWEWRDDLWPHTSGLRADLLSSRRSKSAADFQSLRGPGQEWDWALELGAPPSSGRPDILSLHERREDLESTLADFDRHAEDLGCHQKLAIEIFDFKELERVWLWQRERPDVRSCLPRTRGANSNREARWTWFRLFMKGRQKIHFISAGEPSAADQPSVWQWWGTPAAERGFAAVLGDPVAHSFSPEMHRDFFARKGMPFFAIPIARGEFAEAFTFLRTLGLKAAAVTSPHKESVGGNTWWLENENPQVANTDVLGLREELLRWHESPATSIAVFGGGGILTSLRDILPGAQYISQRTGRDRDKPALPATDAHFDLAVWAASPDAEPPPWSAREIYDLNYREDSRAREWALRTGARYTSGLGLFRRQALEQQNLWRSV